VRGFFFEAEGGADSAIQCGEQIIRKYCARRKREQDQNDLCKEFIAVGG